jgi:hypothetical protein
MRNRYSVATEVLVRHYSVELLTMQAIADRYGMSKQAVWHRLKKIARIEFKATHVPCICTACGESFTRNRARIVGRGGGKYCSTRCYMSSVSLYGSLSRQGQRSARESMEAALGRALLSNEVVHHINGDHFDNRAPGNLMLFGSNAEHMSFHKSGRAKELKESYEKWLSGRKARVIGAWSILPG